MKTRRRLELHLLTVGICVFACALAGCLESTFTLARESKLPKSMTPPGFTPADVSARLNFYSTLWGADAKFIVVDLKGKKLAELKGKSKELSPFGYYRIATENGVTVIVQLRPYREHENMEQNGIPVARFYVIGDPSVVEEQTEEPK